MRKYILSELADQDLDSIFEFTTVEFSLKQSYISKASNNYLINCL